MSETLKELLEEVRAVDAEALAVEKSVREVAEKASVVLAHQKNLHERLLATMEPGVPYRLDDSRALVKEPAAFGLFGPKMRLVKLADPATAVVPDSGKKEEPPALGRLEEFLTRESKGVRVKARSFVHSVLWVWAVLAGLAVAYLLVASQGGHRPGPGPNPRPPAPAPDHNLSELGRRFRDAVTHNLVLTAERKKEARALGDNFAKVSAEVQQAVAGAGNEELKNPEKIEARLKQLNSAAVTDRQAWLPVFTAVGAILADLEKSGTLAEPGDYVTTFNDAAAALRSVAR